MQIVEDAIASGHKILLFSGFTSMFEIIAKELEERGIEYSMLTGKTKVDTRVAMVEEFNNSKEVKVFLISSKVAKIENKNMFNKTGNIVIAGIGKIIIYFV